MSSIDERIVQMQFDNKQFESGVQTSIKSLANLKKGLNLDASAKSLANLEKTGKSFSLESIGASVEAVAHRFSTLGIIGMTALQNIANQAIHTGEKMLKALTIDPIMSGFSEYETKVNAIQTILSNTASEGTTMADVTKVIDELNTYADKTIYNFAEMTRNIGTFTAAGVGLKDSAAAIQGIANLAAASGSSSQQASTAMYQLSQALAAGTVKLMDWNSVVNAGMGGQKFQEALKQTAREMREVNDSYTHDVDALIKKNGSFRESLQAGWITADVLNATLKKFTVEGAKEYAQSMLECGKFTQEQADALIKEAVAMEDAATKVKTFTQLWDTLKESVQSGWGKSWELLVGDFEEARDTLTELSNIIGDMINASADKRNAILTESLTSGWKKLVNEGVPDAKFFQDVVTQVATQYNEDIGKMIADSGGFEKSLKSGWLTADILTESLGEYAKKLSELTAEQREEYGITQEQIDSYNELHEAIQNGTISVDELAKSFMELSGREKIFASLTNAIRFMADLLAPIGDAFDAIFAIDASDVTGAIDALFSFTSNLKVSEEVASNLRRTFEGLFSVVDIVGKAIGAVAGGVGDIISYFAPAAGKLLEFTAGIGDYLVGVNEAVSASNIFGKAVDKVVSIVTTVISKIKEFASVVVTAFKGDAAELPSNFEWLAKVAERVKTAFKPLAAVASAVGKIFQGLGGVLSSITPLFVNLGSAIGDALSNLANWISNGLRNIDYNAIFDVLNSGLFAGILASVMKFFKNLGDAVDGGLSKIPLSKKLTGVLDGIKGAFESWQQSLKADIIIQLAKAIGIVAASLTVLSLVDSSKLSAAVGAMASIFVELVASMAVIEKIPTLTKLGNLSKLAPGMIALSTSVLMLAGAVGMMSGLNWQELLVGLTGVAGVLASLALFAKFSEFGGVELSGGLGLIGLASAILILGNAVKALGAVNPNQVLVGVTAIGALLAVVGAFSKATSGVTGIISTATGIVILGSAMLVFSQAVTSIGSIPLDTLGIGIISIAGSLSALAGALRLMPTNMLSVGAGMLAISTSLVILASAMERVGNMNGTQIDSMIIGLAGALTVLVVSVNMMNSALPGAAAMVVMASAILLLTPALKGLGNMSLSEICMGLLALCGAMAVLGDAGYALAPVSGVILTLSGSLALLGVSCVAVGAGVLAFSAGLAALAVSGTAGATAIVAIVASLTSLIPMLLQQIGNGIVAFAQAIGNGAEAIGVAVIQLVTAITNALVTCIPMVVNGILQLATAILQSLATHAPTIASAGIQLIAGLITALAQNMSALVNAGVQLMITFINSMADAIRQNGPLILDAIANLMSSIVEFALTALATLANMIPVVGDDLASGIMSMKDRVRETLTSGDMQAVGQSAMSGMASGLTAGGAEVGAAGTMAAQQGVIGIQAVAPEYSTAGTEAGVKYGEGITAEAVNVEAAGQGIADKGASGAASENGAGGGFYTAGANAGAGFIEGISSKLQDASAAGRAIAEAAYQAAMRALDEKSPSRVMRKIGAYGSEGLVIGLLSMRKQVDAAGYSVGEAAVESTSRAVQHMSALLASDMDTAPTIRPVLDLSGIEKGTAQLNGILGAKRTINLSTAQIRAANIADTSLGVQAAGREVVNKTINNNFTQNNYSPKALSRIEIYRQTNNQFTAMKGALS